MPNGRSGGFLIKTADLKELVKGVSNTAVVGQMVVLPLPIRAANASEVTRFVEECPHDRMALRANISETGLVLLINEQKGEKEEIRDEREFSWCCSFPWGFGCRGTKRRLASWRAAAQ